MNCNNNLSSGNLEHLADECGDEDEDSLNELPVEYAPFPQDERCLRALGMHVADSLESLEYVRYCDR